MRAAAAISGLTCTSIMNRPELRSMDADDHHVRDRHAPIVEERVGVHAAGSRSHERVACRSGSMPNSPIRRD